jgi:hypothetical protein
MVVLSGFFDCRQYVFAIIFEIILELFAGWDWSLAKNAKAAVTNHAETLSEDP